MTDERISRLAWLSLNQTSLTLNRAMKQASNIVAIAPILINISTVAEVTSISVATLERMTREGKFPRPRKISDKRVGWLLTEVVDWANSLPVSDLLPPPNTGAPKPRGRA